MAEASAVPSEDPILGPKEEDVEAELEAGPVDSEVGNREPGDDAPDSSGGESEGERAAGKRTGKPNGLPKVGVGTEEGEEKRGDKFADGGNRQGEKVPTGEVVGIVQRAARDYVACLQKDDEESSGEDASTRLSTARQRCALHG